jgi:hypothetical protein
MSITSSFTAYRPYATHKPASQPSETLFSGNSRRKEDDNASEPNSTSKRKRTNLPKGDYRLEEIRKLEEECKRIRISSEVLNELKERSRSLAQKQASPKSREGLTNAQHAAEQFRRNQANYAQRNRYYMVALDLALAYTNDFLNVSDPGVMASLIEEVDSNFEALLKNHKSKATTTKKNKHDDRFVKQPSQSSHQAGGPQDATIDPSVLTNPFTLRDQP